jgi:glucose/arabinose dehydrogenase
MSPARFLRLLILLCLVGSGLAGCGETKESSESLPDLPTNNSLTLQLVTANLTFPVFMTAAPGDSSRLFIVEQRGRIRIVTGGALLSTSFLNITSLVRTTGEEEGLLGMAFDPSYVANGRVYAFYTNTNGDLVIARFLRLNVDQADATPTILLTIPHPTNSNHNGGMLVFGPDGCLYAGTGDGGGGGDPNNNGQNSFSRLGKILRLNPDTGSACSSITTNPFFIGGGAPEVWSLGLRNPWRFSFDRVTNDLYIADVGQAEREEINVSPAPNEGRGLNYGWRLMEGFLCFNPSTNCNQGGLTLPVLDYPHAEGACSVTGGYVYRGSTVPALSGLRGTYFYADFCNGFVRSFRYQNGQVTNQFEWPLLNRTGITSFGEDAQGELYLMTQTGNLYKIVPN